MLYTGRGDNGQTGLFGTKEKLSKSSPITEALGSLDEANSYIGICKSKMQKKDLIDVLNTVQNTIFIMQAQVAGADKKIPDGEVKKVEQLIADIEAQLPPIKSFLIPGSTEISAHFDFARTLVRRAERRVVAVSETNPGKIDVVTLAYLNRLSSLMYAYARFFALDADSDEQAPTY